MKKFLMLLTVPALLTGCAKSNSTAATSTSSTVAISGTLTDNTDSAFIERYSARSDFSAGNVGEIVFGNTPLSTSNDSVICLTSETPVSTFTGTVDSTGRFSVSVPSGLSVGCKVVNGDDSSTKANFFVTKSSGKDMRGNTQLMDRFALASNASLGSISYNEDGKATISQSTLGSALESKTISDPFDPSGTWKVTDVDFTLPTGYSALCATDSNDCSGPKSGESLFIKRIAGQEWSNGARTGQAKYGIMVWSSEQAFQSCGSKLGVSYDDAKTFGGIDLTESGVTEGALTWSSTATSGATTYNITEGWKIAEATSNYAINNCKMTTVGGLAGWKCTETNADADYQVNLGGGCYNNVTNAAVNVTNWNTMSCADEVLTGTFNGYTKRTCTASSFDHDNDSATAAINATCIFTSACFKSDGTTALCDGQSGAGHFNWSDVGTIVSANALCSSINSATSTAHALAQLQCYANGYWQSGLRELQTACLPSLRTDYSAETAGNFIISQNGPQKAANEYVFEQLDYKSNNVASFMMNDEYSKGTQVKSGDQNIWINCRVAETFSMTISKVTTTKFLADFTVETRLIDTKRACKANESSLSIGVVKSMFYLTPNGFSLLK